MKIDFSVNQKSGIKIQADFWKKIIKKVERNIKLKTKAEISIAVIGLDKMRTLNRIYRKKDKPTDVLSFESDLGIKSNDNGYLGEVIICYPQAVLQAKKSGVTALSEIEVLLVHGILHLLGFDHKLKSQAEEMEALQEKIVKTKIK